MSSKPATAEPTTLKGSWVKPAVGSLARAFESEPLGTLVSPGERGRLRKTAAICHFIVRYGMRHGEVWTTSPAAEGTAVWLPSGPADFSFLPSVAAGGLMIPLRLGIPATRRVEAMDASLLKLRRKLIPSPHLYLALVGVAPMHQGKGHSRTLLAPILARLDAEGTHCCLETLQERNVPLYRHFGFDVVERTRFQDLDLDVWFMYRKPRPGPK